MLVYLCVNEIKAGIRPSFSINSPLTALIFSLLHAKLLHTKEHLFYYNHLFMSIYISLFKNSYRFSLLLLV